MAFLESKVDAQFVNILMYERKMLNLHGYRRRDGEHFLWEDLDWYNQPLLSLSRLGVFRLTFIVDIRPMGVLECSRTDIHVFPIARKIF